MIDVVNHVWKLHGDGRTVGAGEAVGPDERLRLPRMLGLGAQHVLAMFGSTALVPVLTGLPVTTTIFFSGVGTVVFNLVTRNRVPSYTGSSFAFIAPVLAAKSHGGVPAALGGILCAGVALFAVGLIVDRAGYRVIEFLLPPVVTGAIVALIGLNLAPVAKDQFSQQAGIALVTLLSILIIGVALREGSRRACPSSSGSRSGMPSPPSSARSTGAQSTRPTGSAFPLSPPPPSTGGRSSSSFLRSCSCSSPRTRVTSRPWRP